MPTDVGPPVSGALLKGEVAGNCKPGSDRAEVVIGDLSQRQMVMNKQEHETSKDRRKRQIRNRMVYNDWGFYSVVQMLASGSLRGLPHTLAKSAVRCHGERTP